MNDSTYGFLTAPRVTSQKIGAKIEAMEALRLSMLPGAVRYDQDQVQSSPSDPMLAFAVRLDELNHEVQKLQERRARQEDDVIYMAGLLEDTMEREVILARYIRQKRFKRIATDLGVSESTVFRLHRSGADKITEMLLLKRE